MEKPNVTYRASSFKMIKGEKSYMENIQYATLDELLEFIDEVKENEDDGIIIHTHVDGREISSTICDLHQLSLNRHLMTI